jgi:eukaryotic-like serine/threonine-protein kinase
MRAATGERGMIFAARYRLVRRLGRGGMATVFLAVDERLAREVAIKRLHADAPEDAVRRLRREARIGAALNHPNVVSVYDVVADGESVLIVMEYVPGRTLAELIAEGPLEPRRALGVLRALSAALDHAHQHGIVHRDLKPANVLVRDDGQVKLADLGIARALEDTALTATDTALGTPSYMAPEQLAGEHVGPAADVYAFGLIAFELLSGRRARPGGTPLEQARRAELEPPPDLRGVRPDLPVGAAHAIRQALQRDPAGRPRSASAVVDGLRRGLERRPAGAGTPPPVPAGRAPSSGGDGRTRLLVLLGLAAVIVAVAGVAIASLGGGESSPGGGTDRSAAGQQAAAGEEQSPDAAGEPQPHEPGSAAGEQAGTDAGADTGGGAPADQSPDPAPGDPADAVQRFYELSAAGELKDAWRLASGNFRSQLQGYSAFAAQTSDLESVEFSQLETTSETGDTATVTFADTATHADYVDHCTGTFRLVAGSKGWLLDYAEGIVCER